jgi:uncharacterized membrane protein YbaN (DUF454 family)
MKILSEKEQIEEKLQGTYLYYVFLILGTVVVLQAISAVIGVMGMIAGFATGAAFILLMLVVFEKRERVLESLLKANRKVKK